MALRVGAEFTNMEFANTYNATAKDFDICGKSRLKCMGGRFTNALGETFMHKYDPVQGEGAMLHILVRAMTQEVRAGRGPISFDLRGMSEEDKDLSRRMLPMFFEACASKGVDPFSEPVEWIPGFMGSTSCGAGLTLKSFSCDTTIPKRVIEVLNDIVQMALNFIINKVAPIAIFCMIARAFAVYGTEYISPTLVWIATTIIVSLLLVVTIYPIGVFITTGLNPITFLKKTAKIGMFAAATNSSAATLPLNTKTCTEELGCSKEISSFVLPTGMTINMNGTTAMHMIAITFIGTAAGINVTPATLALTAFLSICTAIGTPAVPVAGTTMVYVVMMGLGFNTELCLIGYSLVLAMNYLPGMAVITLNVVGDAATNVIVNAKEKRLNKEVYDKK